MRHFHKTNNKYFKPTVNLDRLWSLVSEQTRQRSQKLAKEGSDKAVIIDVTRAVRGLASVVSRPLPLSHLYRYFSLSHTRNAYLSLSLLSLSDLGVDHVGAS